MEKTTYEHLEAQVAELNRMGNREQFFLGKLYSHGKVSLIYKHADTKERVSPAMPKGKLYNWLLAFKLGYAQGRQDEYSRIKSHGGLRKQTR